MDFTATGMESAMAKTVLGHIAGVLSSAWRRAPAAVSGTRRDPAAFATMIYASAKGPLLAVIRGEPFAGRSDAVCRAMDDCLIGRSLTFTPHADRAAHPEIRLILRFDPPADLGQNRLCDDAPTPAVPEEGRTRVTAAFCAYGALMAAADGWVGTRDPTDPRFRQMMGQLVRTLFEEQG